MRAYVLRAACHSIDDLRSIERARPQPRAGQAVVRVRAASLNSRDQAIAAGTYVGGALTRDVVPLSDGAGEVLAIGPGVTRVKPGDRVAMTFFQVPPDGAPFARRLA